MANNNGQRVGAFLLALLFLLTTVGAAGYVIYELNSSEGGLVNETSTSTTEPQESTNACGQSTVAAVEPRTTPTVTTAEVPVAELITVDIEEGTGAEVQPGDCVAALYYGTLASTGEFFDGNYETGQPIEFPLTGVIPGWTQGIPGMKEGGVRRLVIPAELAYGEAGSGDRIPPNSDLVFEVQIITTRRNE
jgi:FKBP-type peptidyl-prolyl cis-trans isomerase